jgi:hypothetical protein
LALVSEVLDVRVMDTAAPSAKDPAALFDWQLEMAVSVNAHRLYGVEPDEFRNYLQPLKEKACSLPLTKTEIPFLLVLPSSSLIEKTLFQKRNDLPVQYPILANL